MATDAKDPDAVETLAELVERLGDVPLERIRMRPPPGTATEQDVVAARQAPGRRLCELVDGVLVEKAMGTRESLLAGLILHVLWNYLEQNDLGQALGADGMLRLMPGLVRIPDVSFIAWERWPAATPEARVADACPDLAIEVLSRKNAPKEIRRKLREYFFSGTRLVWVIQPKTQTAQVYTSPTEVRRVGKGGSLDGAAVLPGFTLSLKDLFGRADRPAGKRT
jgi:Uma2 family endonuclease